MERASGPDVFIITVDTLRADHLGCYGYDRSTSPNIDQLSRESVLFSNAVTTFPSTSPSIGSMMTGRYPFQIGVFNNFVQLHDKNLTLAEILQAAGYRTGAFVSNFVLIREISNLQQGFDHYDDYLSTREVNRDFYQRLATDTVERALGWLSQNKKEPVFMWLHLMDPHGPYTPPAPFDTMFEWDPDPIPSVLIPKYQYTGSTDFGEYVSLYDGEIAYADHEIGRFIKALKAGGRFGSALIIFHADHGESLDEHAQYLTHGNDVYEPCLHIPFIVKLPDGDKSLEELAGTSTSDLVSVLDISPTILTLAGLKVPELFEGRSLFQKGLGQASSTGNPIFVESLGLPYHDERSVAIRGKFPKLCYFVNKSNGEITHREFFQLEEDTDELYDLWGNADAPYNELSGSLDSWLDKRRSYRLPFVVKRFHPSDSKEFIRSRNREGGKDLDQNEMDALRKLGYVE